MKRRQIQIRQSRGNMMPLVISILVFVVFTLALFFLSFTRMLGSHEEQRTAIESASLAAAHDLGAIVIEDPNFGFLSLSDQAPTGKNTRCGDNYFVGVQSINSLLATIRLDMMIADQMNDDTMRSLVKVDYANAMAAKDNLNNTLSQAILPAGFAFDFDGNRVEPYKSAEAAYQNNAVRMNGGVSQMVPGSMKLSLGVAQDLISNTKAPKPLGCGSVSSSQIDGEYFRAFMNVPYNGYDFVFAAVGLDSTLIDKSKFKTADSSLPYVIADLVKCEADQKFSYKDERAQDKVATTHAVACAQPVGSVDPLPSPGAFELVFTPEMPPEIGKWSDIFLYQGLQTSPTDRLQSPRGGDYPGTALNDFYIRILNDNHPQFGKLISFAFYDWVRRGREHVDVTSLINTLNSPLNQSMGAGVPQKHQFSVNSNGQIDYTVVADTPSTALSVSDHQYRGESGLVIFSSNKKTYDAYLRDFVYQPGRINGGIHAGEPINSPQPTVPGGGISNALDEHAANSIAFTTGPAGGAVRPTYQDKGVAVQLRFKTR
jgi:hypothetical protein